MTTDERRARAILGQLGVNWDELKPHTKATWLAAARAIRESDEADVARALEKAAGALAVPYKCGAPTCPECTRERSRAAVLAFIGYLPPDMTVAELAAAIEKEQPNDR